MMACPPPAMDEEQAFLAALGRTEGYVVEDDLPTLAGGGRLRICEVLD